MKAFRSISAVLGIALLVVGLAAVLNGGGRIDQVAALGHTLITAGAIILAGALISSAIVDNRKE
jgi:drug/metabolite transporter (DMT)-like permease